MSDDATVPAQETPTAPERSRLQSLLHCDTCTWTEPGPKSFTSDATMESMPLHTLSESQRRWAARPLRERLEVIRRARLALAARSLELADAISPALVRSKSDTLTAEVLPLLDACRFLERSAARILAPRKLGRAGRPLWLSGVVAEVHREPLGHVLVIGPSNFPLFLPGVQVIQALAAGNAVTWKPGTGSAPIAELVASILRDSGIPKGVLRVTADTLEASEQALATGADKVIFTGSAQAGQSIQHALSVTSTPSVMELSGADAIIVLPSADLALVAKAVAFGLRLNGAAVCMSPRRLFATPSTMQALRPLLDAAVATIPSIGLNDKTSAQLTKLTEQATTGGAQLRGALNPSAQQPLLIDHATTAMSITQADIFAPVLSLIEVTSMMHVPEQHSASPFGLTAAIFGDASEARTMAASLRVGSVLINDIIAPTADPRLPFGGRNASGFGATRGTEGLLEVTAIKTLIVRRNRSTRHLDPTTDADANFFAQMIQTLHGTSIASRWNALRNMIKLAPKPSNKNQQEKL